MTEAQEQLGELSTEERAQLADDGITGDVGEGGLKVKSWDTVAAEDAAAPEWGVLPAGFKIPPGKQLHFVKFPAEWTDRADLGDRWCLCWALSVADEKLVLKRCSGNPLSIYGESAKQMIRLIDGKAPDQTKHFGPGTLGSFWDDIGSKCRQQLKNLYVKTHALSQEQTADFFTSCLVSPKASAS